MVHSDTFEEHCLHLRDVLDRLSKAGLTAKPSKCSLAVAEAHYLGYVIGHGKLRPELAKVNAVLEYPRPFTKRDVRSFFGLCGYYRRFVPNFAQIAVSLTDLTKKKIPLIVHWTVTSGTEEDFVFYTSTSGTRLFSAFCCPGRCL